MNAQDLIKALQELVRVYGNLPIEIDSIPKKANYVTRMDRFTFRITSGPLDKLPHIHTYIPYDKA